MSTMRSLKNVVNNYTNAQVKVREATSNDPWGPSSSVMSEIADATYNVMAFSEIMTMIWKRINDHGKNWRHVYKSLVLLEYIIKTGSERVATHCRENIFAIQTLKDFQFFDKDGKDQGLNVREKSKTLVALLKDEERLKAERMRALKAKERFAQASQGIGSDTKTNHETAIEATPTMTSSPSSEIARTQPKSEMEQARPQTVGEEELQLQLALAMSKEEASKHIELEKSDDLRLQMAISESASGGPQQPTYSQPSTLLNLVDPAPPPVINDPWGSTSQPNVAPVAAASDPWGLPSTNSAPSVSMNDPWSAPSQPALPPKPPMVAAASDPWGIPPSQPAQPVMIDPWNSNPSPAQVDPWSSNPPIHKGPPPDPDSDFDFLRNDTAISASSNSFLNSAPSPMAQQHAIHSSTNGNAFNMDGMNQALTTQKPSQKKPEDFLGENSSLVNLDSLIGPARQSTTTMEVNNPFLMSGGGGMIVTDPSPAAANPFHQPKQPAPSINQMRQPPLTNQAMAPAFQSFPPSGGPALPPPLIPSSGFSQQQQNPFL